MACAASTTIEDAEALAGHELRVPADRLASLPVGTFYRHDLVGCRVETTGGADVGVVTDVEGTMGGSRLVVAGSVWRSARAARDGDLPGGGSGGEADRDRSAGWPGRAERAVLKERDGTTMPTFDVVTIFPAMIEEPLAAGILGRAIDRGAIDVKVRDLRDFTTDRHRVVDDQPYGGGPGMVLKPDPIFRALDAIEAERGAPLTVIMTSPQGARFTQADAQRLSAAAHLVLLCGRYEGFDDRVRARVTEELSIGDYVLTGGELPALVVLDAVARLMPGSSVTSNRWSTSRSAAGCSTFRSSRVRQQLRCTVRQRPTSPTARVEIERPARTARPPTNRSRCPTFCCRATTRRYGAGASARR